MELALFDDVAEAVRGLLPRDLCDVRCRPRRYGLKVWFGGDTPAREHYEAQVVAPRYVPAAKTLAVEVGFHAEHPDVATNDAVLAALGRRERTWRRALGAAAEAGPFLGREDVWRRVSETWADPDLSAPDLAFELGARLADYVLALEPLRR